VLVLPPLQAISAPSSWKCIDFISDLHLDASRPHTFDAWKHFLANTAGQAVFILGDLFEAWIGDDACLQEGFEAETVRALHQAARCRWIGFLPGNRDFLVGSALLQRIGVHLIADPTVLEAHGQRILLTHGDLLCLEDVDYQRFRLQVRDPNWQRFFLARPLAERRELARNMRDASRQHQNKIAAWADVDPGAALSWLTQAQCSVLVHGHTHRPGTQSMAPGYERHVLTDWELDDPGPARAEILRLTHEGFARIKL
jgi:UDP-2,3-diacylglucosamine hydrolase